MPESGSDKQFIVLSWRRLDTVCGRCYSRAMGAPGKGSLIHPEEERRERRGRREEDSEQKEAARL